MSQAIQRLFTGIPNPIAAQSLFNTWKSGLVVEVDRLPPSTLGTALLTANVAYRHFHTEVVDDYNRLYERVKEEYERDVPRFWHPEGFLIAALALNYGPQSDYDVTEVYDGQYIHTAVKTLFQF